MNKEFFKTKIEEANEQANEAKRMRDIDDIKVSYSNYSIDKWIAEGKKETLLSSQQAVKEALLKTNDNIDKLIASEKECQAQDVYEEQEIEHINQIEMANKILVIIKERAKKDLGIDLDSQQNKTFQATENVLESKDQANSLNSGLHKGKDKTAENNQENERANDNIALLSIASEGDGAKPESSRAINGDGSSPDLSSQLNPSGCGKEISHSIDNVVTICGRGNNYIRLTKDKISLAYKFELCPICFAKRLATAKALYSEKKKILEFLREINLWEVVSSNCICLSEVEDKVAYLKSEIKQIENEVPEVKE